MTYLTNDIEAQVARELVTVVRAANFLYGYSFACAETTEEQNEIKAAARILEAAVDQTDFLLKLGLFGDKLEIGDESLPQTACDY